MQKTRVKKSAPAKDGGILYVLRHSADGAPKAGDSLPIPDAARRPSLVVMFTPAADATPYDIDRLERAIQAGDHGDCLLVAAQLGCECAIFRPRGATNAN